MSLFRKKRFDINFFVRQKALKFVTFIKKENARSFFRFSFRAFLSFILECLGLCYIDQSIRKGKL